MKRFNIVTNHTVTIKGYKDPLPIGSFYGRVEDMTYFINPVSNRKYCIIWPCAHSNSFRIFTREEFSCYNHLSFYDPDEYPGDFITIIDVISGFLRKNGETTEIIRCERKLKKYDGWYKGAPRKKTTQWAEGTILNYGNLWRQQV